MVVILILQMDKLKYRKRSDVPEGTGLMAASADTVSKSNLFPLAP